MQNTQSRHLARDYLDWRKRTRVNHQVVEVRVFKANLITNVIMGCKTMRETKFLYVRKC